MRIAIVSDVHGNYPALLSVVEDAMSNHVDKFIFAGDYIFDLPFSNEVVRFLMKMDNAYIIKGNRETYLDKLENSNQEDWIYDQFGVVYQTYRELQPDIFDFLRNLDEECYVQLNPNTSIYVTHWFQDITPMAKSNSGSANFHKNVLVEPFSREQYLSEFSNLINSDEYSAQINQIDADIIVFGHNHLQAYGYCGKKLIVNPGSCGQPLDFNNTAPYSIVEETEDGFIVHEKRVAYDVEAVIRQAKKTIMYEKGKVWSELVFLALRTGRDYFGIFFEIAEQIALTKNEKGSHFSNATWEAASEIFAEEINLSTI